MNDTFKAFWDNTKTLELTLRLHVYILPFQYYHPFINSKSTQNKLNENQNFVNSLCSHVS